MASTQPWTTRIDIDIAWVRGHDRLERGTESARCDNPIRSVAPGHSIKFHWGGGIPTRTLARSGPSRHVFHRSCPGPLAQPGDGYTSLPAPRPATRSAHASAELTDQSLRFLLLATQTLCLQPGLSCLTPPCAGSGGCWGPNKTPASVPCARP